MVVRKSSKANSRGYKQIRLIWHMRSVYVVIFKFNAYAYKCASRPLIEAQVYLIRLYTRAQPHGCCVCDRMCREALLVCTSNKRLSIQNLRRLYVRKYCKKVKWVYSNTIKFDWYSLFVPCITVKFLHKTSFVKPIN